MVMESGKFGLGKSWKSHRILFLRFWGNLDKVKNGNMVTDFCARSSVPLLVLTSLDFWDIWLWSLVSLQLSRHDQFPWPVQDTKGSLCQPVNCRHFFCVARRQDWFPWKPETSATLAITGVWADHVIWSCDLSSWSCDWLSRPVMTSFVRIGHNDWHWVGDFSKASWYGQFWQYSP